jgi:hypothetical protein
MCTDDFCSGGHTRNAQLYQYGTPPERDLGWRFWAINIALLRSEETTFENAL